MLNVRDVGDDVVKKITTGQCSHSLSVTNWPRVVSLVPGQFLVALGVVVFVVHRVVAVKL